MHFLGFIIITITLFALLFTSLGIKKRVIGKMLSRQEYAIRMQHNNPLKTYEHADIERTYTWLMLGTGICIFIKGIVQLPGENGWSAFFTYYFIAILVIWLSDTIVFLIRMVAGCIPGAILFDEKEEMFYVFPSITSNIYKYKEYRASNLFYLIENYTID